MPEPFSTSAAATLLAQAAKAVPPIMASRKPKLDRRIEAYVRFQTATANAVAWAESMGPLQDAGPSLPNGLLAAALLASPVVLSVGNQSGQHGNSRLVSAMATPTALAAAVHVSDVLAHKYVVVRESSSMWRGLSELLAALYEVRLVGAPSVRVPAEEVVALMGSMLEAMPVRRYSIRLRKPADDRYLDSQRAVIDALRRFSEAAQSDLRPHWRRRDRKRSWQLWRTKPTMSADVDVEHLIRAAADERSTT